MLLLVFVLPWCEHATTEDGIAKWIRSPMTFISLCFSDSGLQSAHPTSAGSTVWSGWTTVPSLPGWWCCFGEGDEPASWPGASSLLINAVCQGPKGFPGGVVVKNPWSLGQEDPLEEEMATHSRILAWEIPWTEEYGRLQSMAVTKSRTRLRAWADMHARDQGGISIKERTVVWAHSCVLLSTGLRPQWDLHRVCWVLDELWHMSCRYQTWSHWWNLTLKSFGFPVTQLVKNPPVIWETWVWSLGWEDPLEKRKTTHSSILAWRISWSV